MNTGKTTPKVIECRTATTHDGGLEMTVTVSRNVYFSNGGQHMLASPRDFPADMIGALGAWIEADA